MQLLLFLVIVIGLIGYKILGFTIVEAFYQTEITIATVRFKEVHPLSNKEINQLKNMLTDEKV